MTRGRKRTRRRGGKGRIGEIQVLVLQVQSRSCSNCQSEYERRKGRPEKREDERRKPENIRNGDDI